MPHSTGNITARELLDLSDHLNLEATLVGQCNSFAQTCSDQQLRQLCQDVARSRMDCFHMLVKHMGISNLQ